MTTLKDKFALLTERGFPFLGSIELTSRCNHSCRYCYFEQPSPELSTGQITATLDRFADAGVISLLLTGGEPFLRPDILDILQHVVKKQFFQTVILSNGSLLDRSHIDFLLAHRAYFGYIRFSFFSHLARVHDAFSGVPGSFDRTLANAERLMSGGFKVKVLVNLTEDNITAIQDTRSFFRSRGIEMSAGLAKVTTSERLRTICESTTSADFYKRVITGSSEEQQHTIRSNFNSRCADTRSDDWLCQSLFGMVAVLANGDITPCLSFRNFPIGNITSDSRPLPEILKTSVLVKQLRSLRRSALQPCGTCRFVRYCILCPGMIHSETGSFDHPLEQTCNYAHSVHDTLCSR